MSEQWLSNITQARFSLTRNEFRALLCFVTKLRAKRVYPLMSEWIIRQDFVAFFERIGETPPWDGAIPALERRGLIEADYFPGYKQAFRFRATPLADSILPKGSVAA